MQHIHKMIYLIKIREIKQKGEREIFYPFSFTNIIYKGVVTLSNELLLDGHSIKLDEYEESTINNLRKLSVRFKVTSEEYHDIAVLLYKGTFHVKVPERNLEFEGEIVEYYTSLTNLYQEGQTGDYNVTLLEVGRDGSQE
jgi:hypothetical protein